MLTLASSGCGSSRSGEIAEVSEAARVCSSGSTVEGIDVSFYEGSIDWNQVKASGVAFAVTRISDGLNYPDSDFDANWAAIKRVGLVRGAYQYFEPGQDALMQADHVVQKVGKLGPGDLPVQLDMEVTGGQSSAAIVKQMKLWIDRVTSGTGKAPVIYTAAYFWNASVGSTDFAAQPLWVANYGVTCPNLPDAWSKWLIWQYGDSGSVPGINGGVDVDKFNGTKEDLARFAGSAPDYAARYVSQSFPLASQGMSMKADELVPAYIELQNTGTKTWTSNTRLATSNPRDRNSAFSASDWLAPNRPSAVTGTVPPGATYRFSFTLHAPASAGVYEEFFDVVNEGVAWFSDPGEGGPPDDQLENKISVAVPTSTPGGGSVDAGAPSMDAGAPSAGSGSSAGGSSGVGAAAPSSTAMVSVDAGAMAHVGRAGEPNTDAGARDAGGSNDGGCGCRIAVRKTTSRPDVAWAYLIAAFVFGARRRGTCAPRPRCLGHPDASRRDADSTAS